MTQSATCGHEAIVATTTTATKAPVMVASDLDGTLIFSARVKPGQAAPSEPTRVVEYLDGKPLSSVTLSAWDSLRTLMGASLYVPVTTRSREQFERITFPRTPRYALCSNGGVLLSDGAADPEWSSWVHGLVAQAAPLDDVEAILSSAMGQPWAKRVRVWEGLFCYLVAHNIADVPGEFIAEVTDRITALGWTVSVQSNKIVAVPAGMSKAASVARLRQRVSEEAGAPVTLLATGDSVLDAPMMEAADQSIRPAHGELHDRNYAPSGLSVTKATGADAGAEILRWMLARINNPTEPQMPVATS